ALAALRLDALGLARRALLSAGSLGLDLFHDERAAAWLAGSTAHADLSPAEAGGAAFAIFLKLLGHAFGWPFPRGGTGALAAALEQRLGALGGTLRRGVAVSALDVA